MSKIKKIQNIKKPRNQTDKYSVAPPKRTKDKSKKKKNKYKVQIMREHRQESKNTKAENTRSNTWTQGTKQTNQQNEKERQGLKYTGG